MKISPCPTRSPRLPDALRLLVSRPARQPGRRRPACKKPCCSRPRWPSDETSQGRPFALHDACPHRGMPLSHGHFDGQQVECSYHGWRFDGHTGQCQLIPSLTADQKLKIDRIYAGSYPCEEHDDFIWVFIPEPPAARRRIHQSRGRSLSRAASSHLQREVQTRVPDRRSALHRRSRNHRTDGSRARAVRPSGMVVAEPRQHPREAEEFRAHPQRLPHERAHAQFEQRALQTAAPVCRRGIDHHDD